MTIGIDYYLSFIEAPIALSPLVAWPLETTRLNLKKASQLIQFRIPILSRQFLPGGMVHALLVLSLWQIYNLLGSKDENGASCVSSLG